MLKTVHAKTGWINFTIIIFFINMNRLFPSRYLISPEPDKNDLHFISFLNSLKIALKRGIRLVQLRAKSLPENLYIELANLVFDICRNNNALLFLNAPFSTIENCNAHGLHLSSKMLEKSISIDFRFRSAAVHSRIQLQQAESIGVDFVTLSPVLPTMTHPEAIPLGWEKFSQLCASTHLPVYALGGINDSLLYTAIAHGAYGIASIRSFWPSTPIF